MFTPNFNVLRIGDRIRLTQPLEVLAGTYSVGHEFTIIAHGARGVDMRDDEGRKVSECFFVQHTFQKI